MEQGQIKRITGTSFTAALLYNLGFLSPFFAVPLQYSAQSRGRQSFVLSSLGASVLILSFRLMVLAPLGTFSFVVLDTGLLFMALTGLYLRNFALRFLELPVRLGVITGAFGLAVLLLSPHAGALGEEFKGVLAGFLELGAGAGLSVDVLYLMVKDVLGRTFLAWYFFFLMFTPWFAEKLGARIQQGKALASPLGDEKTAEAVQEAWVLPEYWVWLLFIPLTLFLVDKLSSPKGFVLLKGWRLYGVSNLLLITAGTYGLRGIRILGLLLRKRGLSRAGEKLLVPAVLFLVFVPGINLVMLIVTAGLGVSELWINFRLFDKE